MQTAAGETGLGWRVGAFALDTFIPKEDTVRSVEVWDAYVAWCRGHDAVPLAFGVFYAEFEKIVAAVGIARRQNGAHVSYHGLGFKMNKGS